MKRMMIICMVMVGLMSCGTADSADSVSVNQEGDTIVNKVVSGDEFKELMKKDDIQLIDVRTADEYSAGKIGDAQNIDFFGDNFKDEMNKLDKSKPTLIYCKSGNRSGKSAAIMKELGFVEVYDLEGGYSNWTE